LNLFRFVVDAVQESARQRTEDLNRLRTENEAMRKDIAARNPNQLYKFVEQATADLEGAATQVRMVRQQRDEAVHAKEVLEVSRIGPVVSRSSLWCLVHRFQKELENLSKEHSSLLEEVQLLNAAAPKLVEMEVRRLYVQGSLCQRVLRVCVVRMSCLPQSNN
jgi:hypothetical protein